MAKLALVSNSDPAPRDPVTTTLQTPGGFFLGANLGGGDILRANATQAGPWETFTVITHDDGRISLQTCNGFWVSAQPDGAVNAVPPPPGTDPAIYPGEWERWTFEVRDVGIALKGFFGMYLCAEGGGGGDVVCNRVPGDTVPGEWEFFKSSTDFWSPPPPAETNPNTLRGVLTRNARVISDDSGPRLPMFCHFMEAFSAFVWGKYDVKAQLQVIAKYYAGVRVLDVLGYHDQNRPGEDPWSAWAGREVTPIGFEAYSGRYIPPTANYYDRKREFLQLVHDCGLKIFDDRGDLNAWTDTQKKDHMRKVGELYASLPFGRDVLGGVFAVNEAWQNGGDDADLLIDMIHAFRDGAGGWLPAIVGLSAPGGSSDPDDIAECDPPMTTWEPEMPESFLHWSQDPATVLTVHGNRGAYEHIIEHYFGYGYDDTMRDSGKVACNTEPVGGGEGVSVGQVNDVELLCGLTAAALLGGQPWTFMSGNGVFWNGPIEAMPGFYHVPRLTTFLPQDAATFPIVCHAGTRFSGTRILGAVDPTRCEHAIHPDGRFILVVHTETQQGNALPCERSCDEFTVINMVTGETERTGPLFAGETYRHPGLARLVVGRLAGAAVQGATPSTPATTAPAPTATPAATPRPRPRRRAGRGRLERDWTV